MTKELATEEKKQDKKSRRKEKLKLLGKHITENKKIFLLYAILRILVIGIMIAQFFNGNYQNVFLCILTLLLFMVPSFIEVNFKIDIPDALEMIVLLFIFAAEILGEIRAYYIAFPYWDMMLHTINGFLAAAIGFSMVELLNRDERFLFRLSPAFLAIVAFCFSMTIGVIWEFFEWGMDMFFGLDMQKDTILHSINSVMLDPAGGNHPTAIMGITEVTVNGHELGLGGYVDIGLYDTMQDLFVNFIGAFLFSVCGYFYVKHKGKGRIVSGLIPQALSDKDFDDKIQKDVMQEWKADYKKKREGRKKRK